MYTRTGQPNVLAATAVGLLESVQDLAHRVRTAPPTRVGERLDVVVCDDAELATTLGTGLAHVRTTPAAPTTAAGQACAVPPAAHGHLAENAAAVQGQPEELAARQAAQGRAAEVVATIIRQAARSDVQQITTLAGGFPRHAGIATAFCKYIEGFFDAPPPDPNDEWRDVRRTQCECAIRTLVRFLLAFPSVHDTARAACAALNCAIWNHPANRAAVMETTTEVVETLVLITETFHDKPHVNIACCELFMQFARLPEGRAAMRRHAAMARVRAAGAQFPLEARIQQTVPVIVVLMDMDVE